MILHKDFEAQEKPMVLTDREIFKKIWIAPRMVFKFIEAYKYEKNQTILLLVAGITGAFQRASDKSLGDDSSIMMIIGTSIIAGVLTAFIFYPFYTLLVSWTGKWLKGNADNRSVLRVLTYSSIPFIFSLVLIILGMIFMSNMLFTSEIMLTNNVFYTIVFFSWVIVQVILAIWSMVLFVIGLAEVQRFSIVKSLFNSILPIMILVVLLLIAVNIYDVYRAFSN